MKAKPTRKKSSRRAKKVARPKAKLRKRASVRKRAVPQAAARKPVLTRTAAAGHSGAHGILDADFDSVEHLHNDIGGEGGD